MKSMQFRPQSWLCFIIFVPILHIAALTGAAGAEPEEFSPRLRGAIDLLEKRKLKEAIEALEQLAIDHPYEGLVDYNLACAHALSGKSGLAFKSLASAVEKGYDNLAWMRRDPDLEALRSAPEFTEIATLVRANFLDDLLYHIQEPLKLDAATKPGLVLFMGGAGSDGSDWVPFWKHAVGQSVVRDTIIVSFENLSSKAAGYFDEGEEADAAFLLLHEWAVERWSIDPARVAIGGFSAGASRALECALRHAALFPRVLLIERASIDYCVEKREQLEAAGKDELRVAMLCGTYPGLFRLVSEAQAALLAQAGIPTRFRLFPQTVPHRFDNDQAPLVQEVLQFLRAPVERPPDAGDKNSIAPRAFPFETCEIGAAAEGRARPLLLFFAGVEARTAEWQARFAQIQVQAEDALNGLIVLVAGDPEQATEAYQSSAESYHRLAAQLIEGAKSKWQIDEERFFFGGYSDGAFHACIEALSAPPKTRGILCVDGITYLAAYGPERLAALGAGGRLKVCLLMGEVSKAFGELAGMIKQNTPADVATFLQYARFPQSEFRRVDERIVPQLADNLRWLLAPAK